MSNTIQSGQYKLDPHTNGCSLMSSAIFLINPPNNPVLQSPDPTGLYNLLTGSYEVVWHLNVTATSASFWFDIDDASGAVALQLPGNMYSGPAIAAGNAQFDVQ